MVSGNGKRDTQRIPRYELPTAGTRRTGQDRYGRSRHRADRPNRRRAATGAAPGYPYRADSREARRKLKEITDRLEQGITELFDSERYKEYLKVMSKFHNYSFNNTVLIAMQKPDASLLAGFSAWKNNFGRNVMRGQKGIKIIAPSPLKSNRKCRKSTRTRRSP